MEVLQQLFINLSAITSDGNLKPVVIRSKGDNFSMGYDCSCHLVKDNDFLLSVVSLGTGIMQLIRNYEAPVVIGAVMSIGLSFLIYGYPYLSSIVSGLGVGV